MMPPHHSMTSQKNQSRYKRYSIIKELCGWRAPIITRQLLALLMWGLRVTLFP